MSTQEIKLFLNNIEQSSRWAPKRSETSTPQQLEESDIVSNKNKLLASAYFDAPDFSQSLVPVRWDIEKADVLQTNIPLSIENILVEPVVAGDGPLCNAIKINKLKRALEQERRTNKYLQHTGELWKNECSRVTKRAEWCQVTC